MFEQNESEDDEENSGYSSDELRYRRPVEKRVAKETHEIRDDLLSMFEEQAKWKWD